MKKVIILTAGFGEGHNAAARNLRDALERVSEDVKVEVLDLFASSYGAVNDLARKAYLGLVQYAPGVWGSIYNLFDRRDLLSNNLTGLQRLKNALGDILHETQPDCVVSTYPVYASVMQELFKDHSDWMFKFVTVVTDSITINSLWYRALSDVFCVPNEATAEVLARHGVPKDRIRPLGFPVSYRFAEKEPIGAPEPDGPKRVLFSINTGKKKAGKVLDMLLEDPTLHLTITVGRDAELQSKLTEQTRAYGDRVQVLGWTNQMPELLLSHHLLIGKAGGATVQEAIAARCPMIVNQVIPGQEEGNSELVETLGLGAVVEKKKEVVEAVREAFAQDSALWKRWRSNLEEISRPDASLRLAELILEQSDWKEPTPSNLRLFEAGENASSIVQAPAILPGSESRMLLCDLHMHSNYSDGKLTVPEVVDFYGQLGFDCICLTDHVADPRRLIGKLVKLSNLTLHPNQFEEYWDVLERERKRAWRRYNMILMTGVEFNKDGYTPKSSAHLLGIDLKEPIHPDLDLPETIAQIHGQGGLAVASHPHKQKSVWGKDTLFLWENQKTFAPLIDAWEIANRNEIFNPVSLKRLPFIANSDFHKPKHIYSWKTLLLSEKDPEAIKACIRENKQVAITLYRGDQEVASSLAGSPALALPNWRESLEPVGEELRQVGVGRTVLA